MLLRHTPKEIKEREALTVNPAKTCQPIGAMYAALGIHGCLPHSHGSQGCCSYHRSTLTRHYKEPVMAGTSSFTEGASVFGGQANLLAAIDTLFTVYNPELIAVHTTCLSETIGDDLNQIIGKAKEEGKIPEGRRVIYANTPSFVGSHVTGFSNMINGIVRGLPEKGAPKTDTVNIIPGWVEPSDMREIKRIAKEMAANIVMFPDTSNVLDGPLTGQYKMYPEGGATVAQIKSAGDSIATLALGHFASHVAAATLETKCNVPAAFMELPIGVGATDKFVSALASYAGVEVPASIELERGRLIDLMSDLHQYFHGKRVAIAGDPDQVIALTQFLVELEMKPVYVITGSPGNQFEKRLHEILDGPVPNAKIKQTADLFELHQWMKNEPVDLLIGNTYGKHMARTENVPFVRFGFPILDRTGHRFFPTVGYMGAVNLINQMINVLLDKKDRECAEEWFELVQ